MMKDVKSMLKELLKNPDLTQSRLALLIGVDQATLSRYISGKRTPSLKTYKRIESFYKWKKEK